MKFVKCAQCGKKIKLNPKVPVELTYWGEIQPMTYYWNNERREVYCNVYCSFKRHEELRSLDG